MVSKTYKGIICEVQKVKGSLLTSGSFAQNFAFNFSGKAIGILLQVVFAPIMARVYGPEAYGIFAIFNAVVINLAMVAALRFENALVLPEDELEFYQLLKLCFISAFIFSGLIFIITLIGGPYLVTLLDLGKLGNLFYCLSPFILVVAVFQITGNWVVRKNSFKDGFQYGVPLNLGVKVFSVGYGFITAGASYGLILSDLVMRVASIIVRWRYIIKTKVSLRKVSLSWLNVKMLAAKYKQFPLYDLPGNWINLLSGQLPIYFLSGAFGPGVVGQLGFAASLLDMPLNLLGSSVAPVFLKKARDTYQTRPDDLARITTEVYNKLFLIGILPFTLLTVFGEMIFKAVFGNEWKMAGMFTGLLGYYYLFRLISSPLVGILTIVKKLNWLMLFQACLFIGRATTLVAGVFVVKDVFTTMLWFSLFNCVAYLFLSVWILWLVKAQALKMTIRSLIIIGIAVAICFWVKALLPFANQ